MAAFLVRAFGLYEAVSKVDLDSSGPRRGQSAPEALRKSTGGGAKRNHRKTCCTQARPGRALEKPRSAIAHFGPASRRDARSSSVCTGGSASLTTDLPRASGAKKCPNSRVPGGDKFNSRGQRPRERSKSRTNPVKGCTSLGLFNPLHRVGRMVVGIQGRCPRLLNLSPPGTRSDED